MAPEPGYSDADVDRSDEGSEPPVACCRTSPDRYVFTEDGNVDGWIATDLVVEPER